MPSYLFTDLETGETDEYIISYSKMKEMQQDERYQQVFQMPSVSTSNSASFPDGHMPNSRKQAMDLEKKIANTTAKMYGQKQENREEYKKEIKELEGRRKAPTGSNKNGE